MLARLLRWLLLLELTTYSALVALSLAQGWLQPFGAAVMFFCAPLLTRAMWVIGLFVLAHAHHWRSSTGQRLSVTDQLSLFFHEWLALIRLFTLVQPFESLWMGHETRTPATQDANPVVLVHGYRCNRGAWWWLRRALHARGYSVATLNLEPMLGDIDDYASQLAEHIESVCQQTGAQRVSLVGHSMGGLVILAYLRTFGGARVSRFISLGTPFRGSPLARFGSGRSALQMQPDNPWLVALERTPTPREVEVTTVCSLHDAYVPPERAVLDGAQVRVLAGIGHMEMPWSPAVFALVCDALEREPIKRTRRAMAL